VVRPTRHPGRPTSRHVRRCPRVGQLPHLFVATIADGPADAAHGQGLELPLTDALLSRWHQAVASGHGQDDVASATTVSAVTGDHAVRL
jgi:hypothetical protein